MSHRTSCYQAEREGRRAADYGRSSYSNPHRDECPEAEQAWDRAYRRERDYLDEQRAQERAEQNRAERAAYERQQQEQYEYDEGREYQRAYEAAMDLEYRRMEEDRARSELWDLYVRLLHGIGA